MRRWCMAWRSPIAACGQLPKTGICANGLNVHKGRITNKPVAYALGYPAHAPEAVLNVA